MTIASASPEGLRLLPRAAKSYRNFTMGYILIFSSK